MFRIFLANLGKYNEGKLVGEWLELPCTDEEFEEAKKKSGTSDKPGENGNYYEEYFIADYETDISGLEIDEYDNIDHLNELAVTIENLDEREQEIIEAMLSDGYLIDEAIERKDDCMIYYKCNDMTDVAVQYIEDAGFLDSLPEKLQFYFDFEKFGRDMLMDGHFIFNNNGNCIAIPY